MHILNNSQSMPTLPQAFTKMKIFSNPEFQLSSANQITKSAQQ